MCANSLTSVFVVADETNVRRLFVMANKYGRENLFFFVFGLPELFYYLKCRKPAVLHNKIKMLHFCVQIPFSGTRQIELHIIIMTGTSSRTTCNPLLQKMEVLTLPSTYILSLMTFLSINSEIYKLIFQFMV